MTLHFWTSLSTILLETPILPVSPTRREMACPNETTPEGLPRAPGSKGIMDHWIIDISGKMIPFAFCARGRLESAPLGAQTKQKPRTGGKRGLKRSLRDDVRLRLLSLIREFFKENPGWE